MPIEINEDFTYSDTNAIISAPLMEKTVLNAGKIALMNFYGNDLTPVEAARTSYRTFASDKTDTENENLVDYLIRKNHGGPLEFPVLTFYVICPIFVARQWVRHRMVSMNEESLRYVDARPEFYIPSPEECKGKPKNSKQGSGDSLGQIDIINIRSIIEASGDNSYKDYKTLQGYGLSNELCRTVLPLGQYTAYFWQVNLRSLFHFLQLRLDKHAQYQIRVYAEAMLEIVEKYFPVCTAAWKNHVLNAKTFSADEWNIISDYFDKTFITGRAEIEGMRPSRIKELLEKLS